MKVRNSLEPTNLVGHIRRVYRDFSRNPGLRHHHSVHELNLLPRQIISQVL